MANIIAGWSAYITAATGAANLPIEKSGEQILYCEEFSYTIDEGVVTHHGIGKRWPDTVKEGPKSITGTIRKAYVDSDWMVFVKSGGVQGTLSMQGSTANGTVGFSGVRLSSFAYRIPVADWYTEEIAFTAEKVDD